MVEESGEAEANTLSRVSVAVEEQQVVDKVEKRLYIGGEWRDASGDDTL